MSNKRTRIAASAAVACIAALLAAGCGSSDDSSSTPKQSDKPAKPAAATKPTVDAELTETVGAPGAVLTSAGCAFGTFKEESPDHVDAEDLSWDTFPPTSGKHLENWAPFGIYDDPVDDGYATHNLEHGGVTVWFGTGVSDEQRDAVEDLADDDEKWLMAPRADLLGLFSGAWAKGLTCPPDALSTLTPEQLADGLDAWYDAAHNQGSEAEKLIPAYAGAMKEPTPRKDISTPS